MKYIEKYNEKFTIEPAVDWIQDAFRKETDEDKIAKNIISKIIPNLDPENIEKIDVSSRECTYKFKINKLNILSIQMFLFSDRETKGFIINIDEDCLDCSNKLRRKIYNLIKDMYDEEQQRLKIQRISTNTGL